MELLQQIKDKGYSLGFVGFDCVVWQKQVTALSA